jgi:hypothetical protein
MRGSILESADLLAITGYEKPGDAARALRKQGVHVFEGKAGIFTTVELLNAAGGIIGAPAKSDVLDPEEIA